MIYSLPVVMQLWAQRVKSLPRRSGRRCERGRLWVEEEGQFAGSALPLPGQDMGATLFLGWGLRSPSAAGGRLMVGNVSAPGKEVCSLTAEGFFIFQTISYLGRFGKCYHACERRKQDKASREQGLADWELHHQMYVPCPCIGLLK